MFICLCKWPSLGPLTISGAITHFCKTPFLKCAVIDDFYVLLEHQQIPGNSIFWIVPDLQLSGFKRKSGQVWQLDPMDTDRIWKDPDIFGQFYCKQPVFTDMTLFRINAQTQCRVLILFWPNTKRKCGNHIPVSAHASYSAPEST